MNSMNKKETQLILNELGIRPNKKLGQNFLIDINIASKVMCIFTVFTFRLFFIQRPMLARV